VAPTIVVDDAEAPADGRDARAALLHEGIPQDGQQLPRPRVCVLDARRTEGCATTAAAATAAAADAAW
jgi:hypothetical protein